jgi:hypothetical protein
MFLRAVFAWQHRKARRAGIVDGRPGAITFIQRFGSALLLGLEPLTVVGSAKDNPRGSSFASLYPIDLRDALTGFCPVEVIGAAGSTMTLPGGVAGLWRRPDWRFSASITASSALASCFR